MKDLIRDSDTLVLQEELVFSSPIADNVRAFSGTDNQIIGNLNLSVVHSESGLPVRNALISIDSIGKTAVCEPCGKVSIRDLGPGKYLLDVISPGFIAQTISITIHVNGSYDLEVKMISNI
jgi:hypothetical protein